MKLRILYLLLFLTFATAAGAIAGPLDDGLAAYGRGDFAVAMKLLQPLAEQGQAAALFWVGEMHYQGLGGIDKNYTTALVRLRKAADKGHGGALRRLGLMYERGYGVKKDAVEANRLYSMALPLLRADAERGDQYAQSWLGIMYDLGSGLAKDAVKAGEWYRRSAEQGNALARNNLGRMYAEGFGGFPKNDAEAAKWYRKAAEQGHASAQYTLGGLYASGQGVSKDETQAVYWYRKAADLGDADAEFFLGWMYDKGRSVVEDETQALNWYRRAAAQGRVDAFYAIGQLYQNGSGIGMKWYRKVAAQGKGGQNDTQWSYETGSGIAKDDAEALIWYTKGADAGNVDSQYMLATMYRDGVGGEKDDPLAFKWFSKAAANGNIKAQFSLAEMYRFGIGTAKNEEAAVKIYRRLVRPSGNGADILKAIDGIGSLEGKGVVISFLKDAFESPDVMLDAGQLISEVGALWDGSLDDSQVEVLLNILDKIVDSDTDKKYRADIIRSLSRIRDKKVTARLLKLARDRDMEVDLRRTHVPSDAGSAIMQLGNVNAVEPLIAALNDPDKDIRTIAVVTLGRHRDKSAVPPLIRSLNDPVESVRCDAIQSLERRGDIGAIKPLRGLLNDPSEQVRSLAAAALKTLEGPPAVTARPEEKSPAVEWQCESDESPEAKPAGKRPAAQTAAQVGVEPDTKDAGHPLLEVQIGGAVTAAAISADGTLLLDGTSGGVARLWEVSSGRQIRRFIGHTQKINAVAFSPDGLLVATASGNSSVNEDIDRSVRLWNLRTGRMMAMLAKSASNRAVEKIAFSIDGRYLLTDNNGLWEVATGKIVADTSSSSALFPDGTRVAVVDRALGGVAILKIGDGTAIGHAEHPDAEAVTLSADGSRILTVAEKEIRLFDEKGKELWKSSFEERIAATVFTYDSQRVIAGGKGWIRVVDRSGRIVKEILNSTIDATELEPSADGNLLLVRSFGFPPTLIDLADGRVLRTFSEHAILSSGGKLLLAWGGKESLRVERIRSGETVQTFHWLGNSLTSVAWAPDGKALGVSDFREVTIWNPADGTQGTRLSGHTGSLVALAYSPDGRTIATGGGDSYNGDYTIRIWDASNGRQLQTMTNRSNVTSVTFSPDGRTILAGTTGFEAVLWDVATGKELKRFERNGWMTKTAFAPDGSTVAATVSMNTSSRYDYAVLFDAVSGIPVKKFSSDSTNFENIAISPDGKYLAAAAYKRIYSYGFQSLATYPVVHFDLHTCAEVRRFEGSAGNETMYSVVRFSPDGRSVFASFGGSDGEARIWNLESGLETAKLSKPSVAIVSAAFSPDGHFIATVGTDGTVRIWNASDGREIAALITLDKGRWLITTPEGRFDTNSLEDLPGVSWVMPDDPLKPLPIETFMKEYYEPRLLARLLNGDAFTPVRELQSLNRVQPVVKVSAIRREGTGDTESVTVETAGNSRRIGDRERSTGVHDLKLFRDGQLVGFQEGALVPDSSGKTVVTFDNIRLPRKAGTRDVEFSAYAFNDDGIKSLTSRSSLQIPADLTPAQGKAYLVNIGVNRYQNEAWNLQYAAGDAQRMRAALEIRLPGAAAYSRIVPVTLTDELATKKNILAVFNLLAGIPVPAGQILEIPGADKLAKATPEDLLIVSFSGHGYVDEKGIFYTFTHDTGKENGKTVTPELLKHIISSDELSRWLRYVDAGDMAMIVDACHSAATVGDGFKPGPMGSRGLGQLAYDKGMKILAASQADDVALESDKLQQGLLTYSLVEDGLEGFQADSKPKDKIVTLSEWLAYGVERVPKLYEEIKTGRLSDFSRGEASRAVIRLGKNNEFSQPKKNPYQTPALFDFTGKLKSDVPLARQQFP